MKPIVSYELAVVTESWPSKFRHLTAFNWSKNIT